LRQKSGKKPGGQKGHRGHHLRQVETPDVVLVHAVERCEHCQQDLRTRPVTIAERRQVIDLPVKRLWVTEHRVEERQCPTCFHLTRASFPASVKAPAQYVGKEGWWVHVCSTARLTHYAAHPSRGRAGLDAIGIAPRFHGTSVHDGLKSYEGYAFTPALCNVHHLRELTFVEEELKQLWAGR
jgi:hypothetical protein